MTTKTITISFQNQTTTYQLGTNFDVMKHRGNNNAKNIKLFDFTDGTQTTQNYEAKNLTEYRSLVSFLKLADATKDGIIDDNDTNKLDKNCPKDIESVHEGDCGSIISRYNEQTGEYTEISTFGL